MRYTLWSRGRLLGETDLAYRRWHSLVRSGDVIPTELGERVLPMASAPSAALLEWSRARRTHEPRADTIGPYNDPAALDATHHADMLAATAESKALNLELRRPDGSRVPADEIDVRDTQLMLAWADLAKEEESWLDDLDESRAEPDPEFEAALEYDLSFIEEWRDDGEKEECRYIELNEIPELPRFQIHVRLFDSGAIP